jgi:hypothetical protein
VCAHTAALGGAMGPPGPPLAPPMHVIQRILRFLEKLVRKKLNQTCP